MREGTCEVVLVHAQHVKAGPGRQPDGNDAAWLAALGPHGVLRARFIPPGAPRELRDRPRARSPFRPARVPLSHRGQKRLEEAHMKLAAGASDLRGGAARAILAALLTGRADPPALAALAKGRLRRQRDPVTKALEGRVTPPHRAIAAAGPSPRPAARDSGAGPRDPGHGL